MRLVVWLAIAASGCGRFGFASIDEDRCTDCFALMTGPATWEDARASCLARGPTSHLATIASAAENASAAALAATIPFAPSETNTNQRQRMWLGGNSIAVGGTWVWDTGEAFAFENWRAGEPDQISERCLIMLGSQGGLWDNRACTTAFEAFLCEDE